MQLLNGDLFKKKRWEVDGLREFMILPIIHKS